MNIITVIDKNIPMHGLHKGLSNGNLLAVWLCHLLTTANHTKVHVNDWATANKDVLDVLVDGDIRKAEFDDTRLSGLLYKLQDQDTMSKIEHDLFSSNFYIYDIKPVSDIEISDADAQTLPCAHIDTTTSYGYHINEDGLMQFGHSKDHRPDLRQIKILAVAYLGKLLHQKTYPGNQADDGVYYPAIEDVRKIIDKQGVLYVGDCKMSAIQTRAKIASTNDFYLTHLPQIKGNKEFIESCIENIVSSQTQEAELVYSSENLIGGGYSFEKTQSYEFSETGKKFEWTENVFVFRSLSHLASVSKGLKKRLSEAVDIIKKLTPPMGRGKRQITSLVDLDSRINQVLKESRVEGLIEVKWIEQKEFKTKYVGRGRGSGNREKKTTEKSRFEITSVEVNPQSVKEKLLRSAWVVFVSNVDKKVINLSNAVLTYRENYHLESRFHVLKSRPLSLSPIFVRNDKQIRGLTNLLMLAVRVIDYTETIIKEQIQKQNMPLKGIYPGFPNKLYFSATMITLLKFFSKSNIILTTASINGQIVKVQIDNLKTEHEKILKLLNIPIERYTKIYRC